MYNPYINQISTILYVLQKGSFMLDTHLESTSPTIINTDSLKANLNKSCNTATVNRWSVDQIVALFEMPFSDLIHQAQTVHRANFDPNAVQVSTLLSIKTGGCSEDCGYCPQAARYHTDVENEPLMQLDDVLAAAKAAKENGASRFCMGAAW